MDGNLAAESGPPKEGKAGESPKEEEIGKEEAHNAENHETKTHR